MCETHIGGFQCYIFLDRMHLWTLSSFSLVILYSSGATVQGPKVTYVDTRAPTSALINEHSPTARVLFLGTSAGKTSYRNVMQALIDKIHLDRGIYSLPNVEAIQESIALCLTRCRAPYVALAENRELSVNVEEVANLIIRAMFNTYMQDFDEVYIDDDALISLIINDAEHLTDSGKAFLRSILEGRDGIAPQIKQELTSSLSAASS